MRKKILYGTMCIALSVMLIGCNSKSDNSANSNSTSDLAQTTETTNDSSSIQESTNDMTRPHPTWIHFLKIHRQISQL